MINYDKLRVKNITNLIIILAKTKIHNKNYISSLYVKTSTDFEDTILFLNDINVIIIIKELIELSNQTLFIISEIDKSKNPIDVVRSFLIQQIFYKPNKCYDNFLQFISKFIPINEQFIYEPNSSENLLFAPIRNFMIDLELLSYDPIQPKYSLCMNQLPFIITDKPLSPKMLNKLKQLNEEIGYRAELEVLLYEKDQFKKNPEIVSKIKHISIENVNAGYDILSFNKKSNNKFIPRYIEVKAVSESNYQFFWSINEIIKSKKITKQYFLYLLPVNNNNFKIDKMMIINNPYFTVLKNSTKWVRECNNYKIWLKDNYNKRKP